MTCYLYPYIAWHAQNLFTLSSKLIIFSESGSNSAATNFRDDCNYYCSGSLFSVIVLLIAFLSIHFIVLLLESTLFCFLNI